MVGTDIRQDEASVLSSSGPFEIVDASQPEALRELVARYDIGTIYHLVAVLSASGEQDPAATWRINMASLMAVLEVARERDCSVFVPSSIGCFGPSTPRQNTPQDTLQRPTSIYGVSKVAGELLCDYYYERFGLDTRGLRFPGIISWATAPGGGTTDYAVEIFHAAVREGRYSCFLAPETRLDMMYMPDALGAIVDLMNADEGRLMHRNAFNVTAMSVTPASLAAEIQRHIPDFQIEYDVDPRRQALAESWPESLDDSAARSEWAWEPKWDLASMTRDMLENISARVDLAAGGSVSQP